MTYCCGFRPVVNFIMKRNSELLESFMNFSALEANGKQLFSSVHDVEIPGRNLQLTLVPSGCYRMDQRK